MSGLPYKTALVVGTGPGIGASLVRALSAAGLKVAATARDIGKLEPLAQETSVSLFRVDATDPQQVARLFDAVDAEIGAPEVVIYNASGRERGALADLDPAAVSKAIAVSAVGGFLVTQQAARRMQPLGHGAILPIRDGQVRSAWSCAERSARTGTQGYSCRAFCYRRKRAQHCPSRSG